MKKNTIWIIGGIVVVLLFFMNDGKLKLASPGLEADRTFSEVHVLAGEQVTATYDTISTDNYLAIIENVPTGWTSSPVSPSADGKLRFTTDFGSPFVMTWTAPAELGEYTFTGLYVVSPDTEYTALGDDIISVCGSQAYSACSGTDRYWYTSCDDIQDIREECLAGDCTDWETSICNGLSIEHSRSCFTADCATDACSQTEAPESEVDVTASNSDSGICRWQCGSGACQQNTAGDYNYDGCVADAEFPIAVNDWKGSQTYITDAEFPFVVNNWKSQANCGG